MENNEPHIHNLLTEFGDEPSDFEHLLDYGPYRYHLLLQLNQVEPECAKNKVLYQLYDTMSRNDEKAIQAEVEDCIQLLWRISTPITRPESDRHQL